MIDWLATIPTEGKQLCCFHNCLPSQRKSTLNPIALRKAILAFLSAIGLKDPLVPIDAQQG